MGKNLFTNFDSFSAIRSKLKDDKIRFSFIGSCVLTGSFDAVRNRGYTLGDAVDDSYVIKVAEGILSKTDLVFHNALSGDKSKIRGIALAVKENNLADLAEEIRVVPNVVLCLPPVRRHNMSDIYLLSINFGKRFSGNLENALKDLGQRCEQRIINVYNNPAYALVKDPSRRDLGSQLDCFKKEYYFITNSLEDTYLSKFG